MADTTVFECERCVKPFDERAHRPLSLPCGHVFCEACLRQTAGRDTTTCPVHQTRFPVSLKSLPSCYAILVNLPKEKPSALLCNLHPRRKLKFRCLTHRVNLCTDCIISHSDSGHKVVSLESLAVQKRTEANAVTEDLLKRLSNLEEGSKWVETWEKKLAGLHETQVARVKQTYKEALRTISAKQEQLLQDLSALWTRQTRLLHSEKISLATDHQRLSDTIRSIRDVQEKLPEGLEQLDNLLTGVRHREPWRSPDLFSFMFQDALQVSDQSSIIQKTLEPSNSKDTLRSPVKAELLTSSSQKVLVATPEMTTVLAQSHGPQSTARSTSKSGKGHKHRGAIKGDHKWKPHRRHSAGRPVAPVNASF